MRRTHALAPLIALIVLVPSVQSAVIRVDLNGEGDHVRIQPAITAAAAGDTISVAPGLYRGLGNSDLHFQRKGLLVIAEGGPEVTVLELDSDPLGTVSEAGLPSSRLVGFTIRGHTPSIVEVPDGTSAGSQRIGRASRSSDDQVHTMYLHGTLGAGWDLFMSDDIDYLMHPWEVSNLDFLLTWSLRAGYRNWGALEYRWSNSSHDLNLPPGYEARRRSIYDIPMHGHTSEFLAKVNPLVSVLDPESALFLTLGFGSSEYIDDIDDGWTDGEVFTVGVEWTRIHKYLSYGFAVERRSITYGSIELTGYEDLDLDSESESWVFLAWFGAGVGN